MTCESVLIVSTVNSTTRRSGIPPILWSLVRSSLIVAAIAIGILWPIDVFDVLFYVIVMVPELYLAVEYIVNDHQYKLTLDNDGLHCIKKNREMVINSTTVDLVVLYESNSRKSWFQNFPTQGYFFVGILMKSGERLALTMAVDRHIDELVEQATGHKPVLMNTEYATLAKWL